MSYTCTKVNSVSSEVAESFWEAGQPYYITEGTMPKYEGSETPNYNYYNTILTTGETADWLYVCSLNNYPVVIIPADDNGDKIVAKGFVVRPDATNSRTFLFVENGFWHPFVNLCKEEGYTGIQAEVINGKSLYKYLKFSCANGLMPASLTDEPYDASNSYLSMLAENHPEFRWITWTFNG